jgi:glucose/arabinose dehydrogenase
MKQRHHTRRRPVARLSLERLEDRRVPTTLPDGFSETLLANGLNNPMAMDIAPDGRIFVAEQGGTLRVIENGTLLPTPFATIPVDNSGERGLLDVTFDPNFTTNHYLYVLYTQATPSPHNHVSRFTANGDVAVPGSEVPIFDIDNLNPSANFHNGGGLHFGTDGKLYITTGDNGTPTNSPSLASMMGKILRINSDGTIPTDNPFFNQTTDNARAIYAKGFRNPFTFGVQPGTATIFVDDVGAKSYEEIDRVVPGADFGWPTHEGPSSDPQFTAPFYYYPHGSGTAAGAAITAGTFYSPPTNQFGDQYLGKYFFADFANNWIRTVDPDTGFSTLFATDINQFTIDLDVDSAGAMYYLTRGTGNNDGAIYKIENTAGQGAPQIVHAPSDQLVSVSQTATFSVAVSGALPRTYQWQSNGVDLPGATDPTYTTPSVALSDDGTTFHVTVMNSLGSVTSSDATLHVTAKQPPVAAISSPVVGSMYDAGDTFTFSGGATDSQTGDPLPASALTWRVDFHHHTHLHPFIPNTSGISSGTFTIPTTGETDPDVWYRVVLTATDSIGLSTTTYRDILPYLSTMSFATTPAAPSGSLVYLDGEPIDTPSSVVGVVGINRTLAAASSFSSGGVAYQFVSWSDGGAITHTISTPGSDTTYTAYYQEVPGWAVREGQTSATLDDVPTAIDVDYAGNTYVAGAAYSANPPAGPNGAGTAGIFISKYLPDGTTYFRTTLVGTGDVRALGITQGFRGFFVVGEFQGTVDFDPGPGVKNLTSHGGYDIFILKLSDEGLLRWVRQIGSVGDDVADAVTADKDLNLYVAGSFQGTADFDPSPTGVSNLTSSGGSDAFVMKFDRFGSFNWAKSFGGSGDDRATALITDATDEAYTTGSFQGTADFDPGSATYNLTSAGGKDVFVSRLDTNGKFSLAARMGGRGDDEGEGIAVDPTNNIYTAGDFTGTADFDPSPLATANRTSAGGTDVFVSKLDPSGNFQWVKQAGGSGDDHGRGIVIEKDNSISTVGDFTGTVDFNPGLGTFNVTSSGGRDAFIQRLTPAGDFDAVEQIGGGGDDTGMAIAHDFTSHVAVAGAFTGNITASTGTSVVNLTSAGGKDIFVIKLQRPTGGAWQNDPPLTVGNASVVEGDVGVTNLVFPVSLASPLSVDASLDYTTVVVTAVPGKDFAATSGTLFIPAGQTSTSITVPVLGDKFNESDETFKLVFSNPVNVKQPPTPAIGTILNDDPLPSLSINNVTVVEGTGGTTNAVFTVSLSALSRQVVTVNFATADGTAIAGTDYTAVSGTVTFPLTTLTETISVPITADALVEPNRTLTVNLSSAVNATLSVGSGTGTIIDDDALPVLSVGGMSAIEGNTTKTFTFPVTLSTASTLPVTVKYATSDGTAMAGSDYTALSGVLTIPAGTTSGSIKVKVKGDTVVEPDENFFVTLSAPTNAGLAVAQTTGTILNDDATLSIGDVSVPEGDSGVSFANFPVTLSAASPVDVSVGYQVYDGTATMQVDYAPVRGTLVIPAGQTSATIAVPIFGDKMYESDEKFTVKLSSSLNASITRSTGTGTILNDDAPPAITIVPTSVVEGNSGVTYAAFSVTLSTPSGFAATVNYATADGTATAGSDYLATSGTLTIPAGQRMGTILVSVLGDTQPEPDETFFVNLSSPGKATLATPSAQGTILDDDTPPMLAQVIVRIGRGPGTLFTDGRSGPSARKAEIIKTSIHHGHRVGGRRSHSRRDSCCTH